MENAETCEIPEKTNYRTRSRETKGFGIVEIQIRTIIKTLEYDSSILVKLRAISICPQQIRELHKKDLDLLAKQKLVENGQTTEFRTGDNDSLYFRNYLCVSNDLELKQNILHEAHSSTY
ncbi:integrase [Gossypium australe]|uniref:Integrase n=1 Tax=Gossypium australe TaxID=47621 RepID=A0A5B6VNK9_9ROSI|nr:integrase [Gossypium australe]